MDGLRIAFFVMWLPIIGMAVYEKRQDPDWMTQECIVQVLYDSGCYITFVAVMVIGVGAKSVLIAILGGLAVFGFRMARRLLPKFDDEVKKYITEFWELGQPPSSEAAAEHEVTVVSNVANQPAAPSTIVSPAEALQFVLNPDWCSPRCFSVVAAD